jgi:hypothetical protein
MNDLAKREIEIARKRLNAMIKQSRARTVLNLSAIQVDRVTLYKAVTHALCFLAQSSGMTHDELAERMRKNEATASGTISMSDKLHAQLETTLGLKRVDEAERRAINRTLHGIYASIDDVPREMAIDLFIQFVKRHGPQIGLPVDIALTRIENLDALQRFASKVPERYIPQSQYGL